MVQGRCRSQVSIEKSSPRHEVHCIHDWFVRIGSIMVSKARDIADEEVKDKLGAVLGGIHDFEWMMNDHGPGNE